MQADIKILPPLYELTKLIHWKLLSCSNLNKILSRWDSFQFELFYKRYYKYFVHQKMLSDLMPLCMKLIHQRQFKFRLLDWHHLVLRQTLSVLNFPAGLILYYHIVLSTVCFCHEPRNSTPRIRPHHNPPLSHHPLSLKSIFDSWKSMCVEV